MSDKQINSVPTRTDRDPSILMGITAPEFDTVLLLAVPAVIIGTIVFGFLLDSFLVGVFLGILLAGLTIYFSLIKLAEIKQGKPTNWLPHTTYIVKDKLGISPAPFIHRTTTFHSRRVHRRKKK